MRNLWWSARADQLRDRSGQDHHPLHPHGHRPYRPRQSHRIVEICVAQTVCTVPRHRGHSRPNTSRTLFSLKPGLAHTAKHVMAYRFAPSNAGTLRPLRLCRCPSRSRGSVAVSTLPVPPATSGGRAFQRHGRARGYGIIPAVRIVRPGDRQCAGRKALRAAPQASDLGAAQIAGSFTRAASARPPAPRTLARLAATTQLDVCATSSTPGATPTPVSRTMARQPNDVSTIDFEGWFRTTDGTRVEPLTARDLKSRFILAIRLLPNQSDEPGPPGLDQGVPASRSRPRSSGWTTVRLGGVVPVVSPGRPCGGADWASESVLPPRPSRR